MFVVLLLLLFKIVVVVGGFLSLYVDAGTITTLVCVSYFFIMIPFVGFVVVVVVILDGAIGVCGMGVSDCCGVGWPPPREVLREEETVVDEARRSKRLLLADVDVFVVLSPSAGVDCALPFVVAVVVGPKRRLVMVALPGRGVEVILLLLLLPLLPLLLLLLLLLFPFPLKLNTPPRPPRVEDG